MRRQTFFKFLITYVCFGFVSIFVIATLTSDLMKTYLTDSQADTLHREASILASRYGISALSDDADTSVLLHELEPFGTYLKASVWVVDTQGNVALSVGAGYTGTAPSAAADFDPTLYCAPSYQTGNFYGTLQKECLSVSAPVTSGVRTRGYVLIHQPLSVINMQLSNLLRIVSLTFLIIFILSLSIYGTFVIFVQMPMREIIKATSEYAKGNLEYQIDIDRSDEIGRLAASLNDMAGKLNEIEETQKKFIANVSHDFRSPLTSIKGYSEAIADGTIPPEMMDKYLGIIVFETERLTDLTEDLLTLSDFDLSGMNLSMSEFDINEAIKSTAASFEGRCIEKHIRIELLFADRTTMVKADRGKIQQVLYNLLDNAVKFSSDDSAITVETTVMGPKVRISVKDYGIGIPKESIGKIWDRFYKTDLSRGLDKKGTGLGLAIVKEIVQGHGETINVISTEGVGSEFIFTLPLA